MTTRERISATIEADLLAAGRAAVADGRADNLSAWVNEALRLRVDLDRRLVAFDEFLSDYESEHGEITEAEMAAATRAARSRAVVVRATGTPAPTPRPTRRTRPSKRGAA